MSMVSNSTWGGALPKQEFYLDGTFGLYKDFKVVQTTVNGSIASPWTSTHLQAINNKDYEPPDPFVIQNLYTGDNISFAFHPYPYNYAENDPYFKHMRLQSKVYIDDTLVDSIGFEFIAIKSHGDGVTIYDTVNDTFQNIDGSIPYDVVFVHPYLTFTKNGALNRFYANRQILFWSRTIGLNPVVTPTELRLEALTDLIGPLSEDLHAQLMLRFRRVCKKVFKLDDSVLDGIQNNQPLPQAVANQVNKKVNDLKLSAVDVTYQAGMSVFAPAVKTVPDPVKKLNGLIKKKLTTIPFSDQVKKFLIDVRTLPASSPSITKFSWADGYDLGILLDFKSLPTTSTVMAIDHDYGGYQSAFIFEPLGLIKLKGVLARDFVLIASAKLDQLTVFVAPYCLNEGSKHYLATISIPANELSKPNYALEFTERFNLPSVESRFTEILEQIRKLSTE